MASTSTQSAQHLLCETSACQWRDGLWVALTRWCGEEECANFALSSVKSSVIGILSAVPQRTPLITYSTRHPAPTGRIMYSTFMTFFKAVLSLRTRARCVLKVPEIGEFVLIFTLIAKFNCSPHESCYYRSN